MDRPPDMSAGIESTERDGGLLRSYRRARAIQKLISRAKPAIDQLQCPVLSGISSDPSVLTGISKRLWRADLAHEQP
jgi:hypothetical protein